MQEKTKEIQENKMGTMPVRKLSVQMSLPIVVSMLVGALYNIIDSIFVGQINEEALTALSLVFPFQNLIIAVGVGTGVGINALLSRSLGEKKHEQANTIAANGVFLGLLSYIFFALFSFFLARPFLEIQTNDPLIIEYGIIYIVICGVFSFGLMSQLIFEKLLQSTGKTNYILLTQGLGAIINIVLDPILIFGLFGFPELGVTGAAVATVIGQIVGGIVVIVLNHTKNHEISVHLKGFKPNGKIIWEIYKIAIPSIIMSSIGSVMIFLFNKILIVYSLTATAVLGVYFKLQSFVFMPVFGFVNGMIPIVAYNYGAQNRKRLISAYRNCLGFSASITTAGFILLQVFTPQILGLFSPSADMSKIGIIALRIISVNFLFAGFNIVSSSLFQALGNGMISMIMSIARQLVVLLPAAYVLVHLGGIQAAWWAFPIAELFASVLCIIFLRVVFKGKINRLPDGAAI